MASAAPSLNRSLPFTVPAAFLLTAPWFLALAGVMIAVLGPAALVSRWAPGALAGTHLITAGFMLQAMCGALLQFSTVVIGAAIPHARKIACIISPLLAAGTLALAAGFLSSSTAMWAAAAVLLGGGSVLYVIAAGAGLARAASRGAGTTRLAIALLGLCVTIGLGLILLSILAGRSSLPFLRLVSLHAAWGLGGWALMLLVTVSASVVPMLQLTPRYPPHAIGGVTAVLTIALIVATAGTWHPAGERMMTVAFGIGLTGASTYAVLTLVLLKRRRRGAGDASLGFFRLAMASILLFGLLQVLRWTGVMPSGDAKVELVEGILVLAGAFVSVISGMLYKIVPFTLWLELGRMSRGARRPKMVSLLPEHRARLQFRLHLIAVIALLLACVEPGVVRLAGVLFASSATLLSVNLGVAARRAAAARAEGRPEPSP